MSRSEKTPSARTRTPSRAKTAGGTAPRRRTTRAPRIAVTGGAPAHEEIERRAYEIFLRDGRHGRSLEHWLQAERELRRT